VRKKKAAAVETTSNLLNELENRFATLAHSIPQARRQNRTSRFWHTVEATTQENIDSLKASIKPKQLEHIDAPIERRALRYKKELPPLLKTNIRHIREFFLTEIAPLTFAVGGGVIQSRAVAERTIESGVDSSMFARFEQMVGRAATLRMAHYVLDMFELPPAFLNDIIGRPNEKEPKSSRESPTPRSTPPQPARRPNDPTSRRAQPSR
jgi:hypothetical protein